MELEVKTLNRDYNDNILKRNYRSVFVDNRNLKGVIALLEFKERKKPNIRNNKVIYDVNYKWLQILQYNKNYCVTVLIDDKDNYVESYFDISYKHDFTNIFNPNFTDLKLDIIINKKEEIIVKDIDELLEAYDLKLINDEEFNMIKKEGDKLVNGFKKDRKGYYAFISSCYRYFKNETSYYR